LGIIDEKGKVLKKYSELNTSDEKSAYSYLHRVIFKIKKMLANVSGGESGLVNALAAYTLVKEEVGGSAVGIAVGGYGIDSVVKKKPKLVRRKFSKYINNI
jgi:hypothetical protein